MFGSQVSGNTTDESDIDLAITIGSDDAGTVRAIYFAKGELWQAELTQLLNQKAHVSLYNDPDCKITRDSCDKCSRVLLP